MSSEIAFSTPASAAIARRADDARGRARDERHGRMRRRLVERADAARRAHHERLAAGRPRGSAPPASREVPRAPARGRRRPPSSTRARTRGTPARPRARRRRGRPGRRRRTSSATARSCVGVAEGEAGGRPPPPRRRASRERVEVELLDDARPGPIRSRTPYAALERDERLRMLRRRAGRGARGPGAGGAGRARSPRSSTNAVARALALEQRVRRDRRPVREAVERLAAPTARAAATTDSSCARSGRDLRGPELAVVEQHGVRERAADVDAETATGNLRRRLHARPGDGVNRGRRARAQSARAASRRLAGGRSRHTASADLPRRPSTRKART